MFNFFKKAFPLSRGVLGVDIGTTSIKIVEMTAGKNKPQLINYCVLEDLGHLERPNTAFQTSTLKLFDQEIIYYLKLMMKKAGFRTNKVVAALPTFAAFTTIIEMPLMSPEEVATTLTFKAKQYVPLPTTAITLDWVKVKEGEDEKGNKKQQIFLIAITNDQIEKYKRIFKEADLNLVALEIEGFSLARALTLTSDDPTLVIDLGARSTGFFAAQAGALQLSGQTDFASASLTRAISSGLGINGRRAEDLKKQRGLIEIGLGPEQELSTLIRPILDVIISEAKRLKENYGNSYRQEIKKVVLAGGGAQLLGVADYFKKELDLPVAKADPFSALLYPAKVDILVKSLGVTLPVAVGAALKNI